MNLRELLEQGDRPFPSYPQVGRYFPSASIEDARRRLTRAIERGDGPGVVIASAGTGKSLLLQVLAAQFRERFDVVLLASAQLCTRRALLQAIHFELGLKYRLRDEGQLRLNLLDQLLGGDPAVEGLLLLVDEAQALPVHLLEELRVLSNLARNSGPRVRLVLAGLPALEEKLASPELESFSQRLSARCYVAPFTREETRQYVRAQLTASAADPERLFASAAFEALFHATDGVPRLVNQVCDRALLLADAQQLSQVDATTIQAAWADLQQLPAPWQAPPNAASSGSHAGSVVEFGRLDDEPRWNQASEAAAVTSDVRPPRSEFAAAPISIEPCTLDQGPDDEPIEPTVLDLDDSLLMTPAATQPPTAVARNPRPRVYERPAPDAVNPFAEHFDEEELVIDSFPPLSEMFHALTPRVENRREPAFSDLVQQALDATAATPTASERLGSASDEETPNVYEPYPPAIRLAVVSDSPSSLERPPARACRATTFGYSPAGPNVATLSTETESASEVESAILVVEDEPAGAIAPETGVRREEYRQLFSRLRHGT